MFRIYYGLTLCAFLTTMFEIVQLETLEYIKDNNSSVVEVLATEKILLWDRKEIIKSKFNLMARLGLIIMENAILESHMKIMAFWTI